MRPLIHADGYMYDERWIDELEKVVARGTGLDHTLCTIMCPCEDLARMSLKKVSRVKPRVAQ